MADSKFPTTKKTIMASQTLNPTHSLLSFFFAIVFFGTIFSSVTSISYSDLEASLATHCNSYVPQSPITGAELDSSSIAQILPFTVGYFTGGDLFPGLNPSAAANLSTYYPKSASFLPDGRLYATERKGIYKLRGVLKFVRPFQLTANRTNRRLREIRFRGPRFPVRRRNLIAFRLNGFWSESSGKLCMVGSSSSFVNDGKLQSLNGVLKLKYPNSMNFTVDDSFVSGSLLSLDSEGSLNHFDPVSILGVPRYNENYRYTLIDHVNESEFYGDGFEDSSAVSLSPYSSLGEGLCSVLRRYSSSLRLEYGSDCDHVNCNPFGLNVGYLPDKLLYNVVGCSGNNKTRILLGFTKSNYTGYKFPFDPKTTLVAEGSWDERTNQLHAVGCRILSNAESLGHASVGDCSIKLGLRFPAVLSIRNRSLMEGQIWSGKNVNDSAYFGKIVFRSRRSDFRSYLPGVRYEYTTVDRVKDLCRTKKTAKRKGKTYPNGYSSDMRFDMIVTNHKGKISYGYSTPLFVGNQLYAQNSLILVAGQAGSGVQVNNSSSLLNISYKMTLTPDFMLGSNVFLAESELSAEGKYDSETGILCMIGCWVVGSNTKNLTRNESVDCEILLNVQFPPLNGKGGDKVKGTIESMREKSNPLYFGALELSSNTISSTQAKESIWRMDFEITVVLISNTLACLFVAMQLFYVKRHPEGLPFISFLMLVLLTLGHMIPLLLNFEALFVGSHNRQDVFLGTGRWLEVNEVIVRVITMVAFLLEFRLLQQAWFSRQGDESQKGLWDSERKVIYMCLPMYICGGLIAFFVHQWKNSNHIMIIRPRRMDYAIPSYQQNYTYQKISLWGDLRSYTGLVLDGFLLPQILLNLICNSREKALAMPFYIGSTIVRLLPHAYDLYRAHSAAWNQDLSYIYANHRKDFYSTFWDIIILCCGLLFATLIYLQQRFGGRCFLPKRFKESSSYEKVPVASSEELQMQPLH